MVLDNVDMSYCIVSTSSHTYHETCDRTEGQLGDPCPSGLGRYCTPLFTEEGEQSLIDDADEHQSPFGFCLAPHTTHCDVHEALQGPARGG